MPAAFARRSFLRQQLFGTSLPFRDGRKRNGGPARNAGRPDAERRHLPFEDLLLEQRVDFIAQGITGPPVKPAIPLIAFAQKRRNQFFEPCQVAIEVDGDFAKDRLKIRMLRQCDDGAAGRRPI